MFPIVITPTAARVYEAAVFFTNVFRTSKRSYVIYGLICALEQAALEFLVFWAQT